MARHRLSSTSIEKNLKVLQPLSFSSNSVKEHVKKSMITGTWAETVDIFSCVSLLKRPICTFLMSKKKWFTFKPLMMTDSSSPITTKKQCRCPLILMYDDFYAQANHFNLLLPQGSCCSAPLPKNTASSFSIDLSNTRKSYASAVKQTSQASSVKLTSTSTKATGSKQPCQASTSYNTTASSSCAKTRVTKPSMSPKATAAKESSSIKKPTPVAKPTTAKAPSSVKQQTPVT